MARKRSQRRSVVYTRPAEESVSSYSPMLQAAMYEVVDNQLRDGTPLETRQTLERLIAEGHTRQEARRLIACAVVSEIFDILQRHEPYDETRYIAALRRLPMMPWE
jgi:peroxiredoxin family protein